MGKIAEALRANLQTIAQSDARSLRELDQELFNAKAAAQNTPQLQGREQLKALLGKGSFQQQTVATIKRICKENGISGYSKLRKAELVRALGICMDDFRRVWVKPAELLFRCRGQPPERCKF